MKISTRESTPSLTETFILAISSGSIFAIAPSENISTFHSFRGRFQCKKFRGKHRRSRMYLQRDAIFRYLVLSPTSFATRDGEVHVRLLLLTREAKYSSVVRVVVHLRSRPRVNTHVSFAEGMLENKSHELPLMAGQRAVAGVKHSSGFR